MLPFQRPQIQKLPLKANSDSEAHVIRQKLQLEKS